jgi:predicted transcriptional regulator
MNTQLIDNSPKRRDKLVIMAEIMEISQNGALKTQIMYKANLSFAQLTQYLKLLSHTSLLEKSAYKGKEIYKATQKGKDFLGRHREIMGLLSIEEPSRNHVRLPSETLLRRN